MCGFFLPDLEWREMEGDDCEFHYGGRTTRLGERQGMGEVKKNRGFLFLSN